MSGGFRITKHRDGDSVIYHACDEDEPCGDITMCHYCRYQ